MTVGSFSWVTTEGSLFPLLEPGDAQGPEHVACETFGDHGYHDEVVCRLETRTRATRYVFSCTTAALTGVYSLLYIV